MPAAENEQTSLWKGTFGDAYVNRNAVSDRHVGAVAGLWSEILQFTASAPPRSILEVGSNIGLNLRALKTIANAELYAVEPNDRARIILVQDGVVPQRNVKDSVAQNIAFPDGVADLVFTSGVLIHIHPDHLLAACNEIHRCAGRYIACIEYFSDKPETVRYRDRDDALFKRDFGSFWLDNFPDLRTLGYGFKWKRVSGLDNVNWWLFEKSGHRPK